ncbi:MAG: ATPase [Bacteroidales bacterium]|nr:ATPase [Bacteroidales bacterium]MDD2425613.1 ATPase [Bacteroidales bacterium]MDD3989759.1 ATPase [Bacteroidales bacterium]
MRLIADSGSTKVDWRVIYRDGTIREITTPGINPFFQTPDQISLELENNVKSKTGDDVSEIHFYGAGVTGDKTEVLKNCLLKVFPGATAGAYTDMLAAARALCGNNPGIAAILGTGANSCFYDGEKIADNVPACGFILGDEGSGAVLGRKLVSDYLKRELPVDLEKLFDDRYNLDYNSIIEKVYRQPFPNRYLAAFSLFLSENRSHPYIIKLLRNSFSEFITRNILKYDYKKYSMNLVGSVAFHYRDIIEEVAGNYGVTTGKVLSSPIEGLVSFHKY